MRPVWLCSLLAAIMLVASQNRGGLLAIMVPTAFALPFTPLWRRAIPIGLAAMLILGLGYAADVRLPVYQPTEQLQAGGRAIGARQLVDNMLSLVGSAEDTQFDDTKMFRVMWWQTISDYTFKGRYFLERQRASA